MTHYLETNAKKDEGVQKVTFLVEQAPEGAFIAQALEYSIFTEADTWEGLKHAIEDAVRCHFEKD